MTEVTQKHPKVLLFSIMFGFGLLAFAGVLVGTSNSSDYQVGLRGTEARRLFWGNYSNMTDNRTIANMSASSSSGPSASLTSSEGSLESFNSLDSMSSGSSGSLKHHLKSAYVTYQGLAAGTQWAITITLMLIYSCIYKTKVVDKITPMVHQPPTGKDQFEFGLCDCVTDPQVCCNVLFCHYVRIAHTNAVSGVCDFWETFCCMFLASFCVCGPLCLNVYFRIHIKDHMGIQDNCFADFCLAFFCLPCVAGQQAMAVDEVLGWKFKCPCNIEHVSASGGYGRAATY